MKDLEKYVNEFSKPDTDGFMRINFTVKAVTIYVFVNGHESNRGEDLSDGIEINIMKKYAESVFTDANSLYLNLPYGEGNGKKAFDYLINLYSRERSEHHLKFINSMDIVPIFVQDEKLLPILGEYRVFNNLLTDYMNNNGKTFRQMPCVIFEDTDGRDNVVIMKELLQNKKSWKNSFPILLIYPHTDYEYIEFESRLKTICMTVVLLQMKNGLFGDIEMNNQCYASRLLTISKPCHIEVLIRAKSLLHFFMQRPQNPEKALESLASNLSSVPFEKVWNRWRGLPCKEGNKNSYANKKISILPVYSMVFPSDLGRDQVKEKFFKPFVEKNYYSQLPIDKETINTDYIRDAFFEKYKHGYGYYITAFDELLTPGKSKTFIEKLESIEIEDFEKAPAEIDTIFLTLVKKLMKRLEDETKSFFDTVFSDNCDWYIKVQDNYRVLMSSLTSLKETIESVIGYWRGIEGDMTLPDNLWNDGYRKELLNSFIDILKSDNPEKDFCELFVRALFTIAKDGITGNRESYIADFDTHSRDSVVVDSWKHLLIVPQDRIVPDGRSSVRNIVICDNPKMISEISLKMINGGITDYLYTESNVKDRIDYIVISESGTWDDRLNKGENPDGDTEES